MTPELWAAFTDLLDQGGPSSRCWCMAPQIGSAYRERRRSATAKNCASWSRTVHRPGLLAFRDELAIGAVASCLVIRPRRAADRSSPLVVHDVPVWVIACFYVPQGPPPEGITERLISVAVDWILLRRAPGCQAYPWKVSISQTNTVTGYDSTFRTCWV